MDINLSWINAVRCAAAIVCVGLMMAGGLAQSKKRDHLTEQEVDQVRENQEIDKRMEVFIKACERRILVLTTPNATQKKKEEEVWGPLPTGSKAELLMDYKRILEEAEEKMDDAFSHEASSAPFKKALSKLKDAANKQIPQLRALASQMKDKKEQNALEEAIEEAETVTKASPEK